MSTVLSIDFGTPGLLDPDVLAPGSKAGPWIVERELGRGGMGAVYAVVHEEIGKKAALKVVHRRLLSGFNPERMRLEARLVNQVAHPNIIDIFETGAFPDGRPYIVMERLEGETLGERALHTRIATDTALAILRQLADALIAAHAAGVVHRDLKLDNVFLVEHPESGVRAKLCDWGIAKDVNHDPHHTQDGQLVGTPQYVSPEQARGQVVTPQSDVYSLGIMAYELFLEELPFVADTAAEVLVMHLHAVPQPPSELWPGIPPALERLVLDMIAKKPTQRPTMTEVAARLDSIRDAIALRPDGPPIVHIPTPRAMSVAAGLAPTEMPITRTHRFRMTRSRWSVAAGGMVLAAAALLAVAARGGASADAATSAPAAALAAPAPAIPEPAAEAPAPAAQPTRAAPSKAPSKAPTNKSTAAPRRGSKVDPDGTLDVYR